MERGLAGSGQRTKGRLGWRGATDTTPGVLAGMVSLEMSLPLCPPFCARVEASDDTYARHSRGAQGPASQHLQAVSCRAADDGGNPGLKFLTPSKPGTRFRTASLLGGTKQRRRRLGSPSVVRDHGTRRCR